MISTLEADRLIDETLANRETPRGCEETSLAASIGRVLARDIFADNDQPPFDRVAMDGVALVLDHAGDSAVARADFSIDGRLPAGVAKPEGLARSESGGVIEVMTGAALPRPWNAVVPWEDLESAKDGTRWRLRAGTRLVRGMNVHPRANDYRKGELLIPSGTRIGTPHIHILASIGCAGVPVVPFPRVTLIGTGDELVDIQATPLPYQIRRSNMVALEACLRRAGFPVAEALHVPDREESMRGVLSKSLAESDVLLLSGGVSKGSKDLVPPTLLSLGCTRVFHGVAHKPGKPIWFGTSPHGGVIFALPGNPVSSLVCFLRYVLPRLRAWAEPRAAGEPLAGSLSLPLLGRVERQSAYALLLPALVASRPDGSSALEIRKGKGSGNFAGLVPSDGIAELSPGDGDLPEGTPARFFPWP
jgi:molybdopterin molybdotransferase